MLKLVKLVLFIIPLLPCDQVPSWIISNY